MYEPGVPDSRIDPSLTTGRLKALQGQRRATGQQHAAT